MRRGVDDDEENKGKGEQQRRLHNTDFCVISAPQKEQGTREKVVTGNCALVLLCYYTPLPIDHYCSARAHIDH